MQYIQRRLAGVLLDAARHFPAGVVTGPRRAGKTTLFRKLFPKARYVLLEDLTLEARVRSDPRAFLDALRPPVVFDEIQNTPELLAYVRTLSTRALAEWGNGYSRVPRKLRLCGHQGIHGGPGCHPPALAFQPRRNRESESVHGGLPEVLARPKDRSLVRLLPANLSRERCPGDYQRTGLVTFRRFLALVASRHGQVLNKTDLAAPWESRFPRSASGYTSWKRLAKSFWCRHISKTSESG